MTNRELPQLVPEAELSDAGRARLQTFLTSLQAAPGVMQAVLRAYPTYDRFSQRVERLQHGTPATQAAELACNLADVLLFEDDIYTVPDDSTHRRISLALKRAKDAQEDGRLSPEERRFIRMAAIVDQFADASTIPDQDIPDDIDTALATITRPAEIPLQRPATHSVNQAA